VLGVGVALDFEVLLNLSFTVGEEGALISDWRAEFLRSMVVVCGDRGDLRIRHRDLLIVAETDSATLIQGQASAGKEVIARAIQVQSSRRKPTLTNKENCDEYYR
jgi:transcriptional regulator with GAF, ATPase, and Fis domain